MRRIVAAAMRAPYVHRRESQRPSGLGPSESSGFAQIDAPDVQVINTLSPEEHQNLGSISSDNNSPTHNVQSAITVQPLPTVPSVVTVVPNAAANRDDLTKPRYLPRTVRNAIRDPIFYHFNFLCHKLLSFLKSKHDHVACGCFMLILQKFGASREQFVFVIIQSSSWPITS